MIKAAQTEIPAVKTEHMWQGSMATAAGLSALAVLYDQVRSNRRKNKAMVGSDDGTMTIDLPPAKQANVYDQMLTTAAVGGLTYAGLSKLYQSIRKKQLEQEVEEADQRHTQALAQAAALPKTAANPPAAAAPSGTAGFGVSDYLSGAPPALYHLAMLAAGAGTYGLLEHTFPRVSDKRTAGRPRKIVIKGFGTVIPDGPGNGVLAQADKAREKKVVEQQLQQPTAPAALEAEANAQNNQQEQDFRKAAAITMPVGVEDLRCAAAMCAVVLGHQPAMKEASSSLIGLIGLRHRDPEALEDLIKQAGFDAAFELSKSGWDVYEGLDALDKRAAAYAAFSDPKLAPTLSLLAVSEMREAFPDLDKRAQVVNADPGYSALTAKFASLFFQTDALRMDDCGMVKSAASAVFTKDMRKQMGALGVNEPTGTGGEVESGNAAYHSKADPIDDFMAGRR